MSEVRKRISDSSKANIAIVTYPLGPASRVPLSNLTRLCGNLAKMVYIVSGNIVLDISCKNFKLITVNYKKSTKLHKKMISHIYTQLRIMRWVIWASRNVNLFIFTLEGGFLPIPVLILRLLRKKVILMPAGDEVKSYSLRKEPISGLIFVLVNLTSILANRLVLYSRKFVQKGTYARYQHKTLIAHEHSVDFAKFSLKKEINERANVVGYLGRFSKEKGVLNFVKSISLVLNHRKDVRFMLCGEGMLSDKIRSIIRCEGLSAHVKLTGWVDHKETPNFLNDLKLIVIPSYTEGIPNIMLEAMACGTPVLATQVGAIPDIIKEGETGFLLDSNDPNHIADKIVELIGNTKLLEKVSINAHKYIREAFSYKKTLEAWQNIINELELSKKSVS